MTTRSLELQVVELGTLPYSTALEIQRDVARRRISGELTEDVLLLVEHPPVVTLGRTAKGANIVAPRELLEGLGVEVFEVERGGDVTFHGPGQLVGYPIFDLKRHRSDLHWYLRQLEEVLIRAVAEFGITGARAAGYTGVWVDRIAGSRQETTAGLGAERQHVSSEPPVRRKLASIGVHARDWVTWHGFALNVNTDLRYFDLIVPCGISGVSMTSVARELGIECVDFQSVVRAVIRAFAAVFSVSERIADANEVVGRPALRY